MLLDSIFLVVLMLMIALGAWRGAVVSGSGFLALVFGYLGATGAALLGTETVARGLAVSGLVAPAIAGTLGFAVVWLIVHALAGVVVAWDRLRTDGLGRGIIDRSLGGFFGLARGAMIVVLLSILISWLDAARDLGVVDGLAAVPDTETSAFADAAGRLVEAAVSSALSDAGPAGDIAARLTARPGKALESVQTILEDERVTGLFSDPLFWTLIQNDSIDYAMNRGAIREIVNDPEMRGHFADLGLVADAAREDRKLFRDTMAGVLAEVAPRIERLHQDPELQALSTDPEIVRLLESGNMLALVNHPRIQRIVDRVGADL